MWRNPFLRAWLDELQDIFRWIHVLTSICSGNTGWDIFIKYFLVSVESWDSEIYFSIDTSSPITHPNSSTQTDTPSLLWLPFYASVHATVTPLCSEVHSVK